MFTLANDRINLDHLNVCITSKSLEAACEAIFGRYLDALIVEKRNARKTNQSSSHPAKQTVTGPTVTELVTQATCQILVKQNQPAVMEFIQKFLLTPLDQLKSTQK